MPQQNNSHNYSVYVCRYAHNMYLMRNRTFTKLHIDTNFEFISDSVEFSLQIMISIALESVQ